MGAKTKKKKKKKKKKMSDYFILKSVKCLYFKEDSIMYQMKGSEPIFKDPTYLKDVDKDWIKGLSKEDKKLIEKDLKKFKKI